MRLSYSARFLHFRMDARRDCGADGERASANCVVDVLAPICVERFQQQADVPAKLTEFNKASAWDRRLIIERGGWATVPGTDTPNSAVSTACAERLSRPL